MLPFSKRGARPRTELNDTTCTAPRPQRRAATRQGLSCRFLLCTLHARKPHREQPNAEKAHFQARQKRTDLAKAKGETGGERQALHQTPGKPKGKDERRRANQKEKTMQRLVCTNKNTGARKHMDTNSNRNVTHANKNINPEETKC